MFRISNDYYSRDDNKLAGTGQGNNFSRDVYWDASYLIIRELKKRGLGIKFELRVVLGITFISAIAFADNTDLVIEEINIESMMKLMLKTYDELQIKIGRFIEENKSKFFA